MPVTEKYFPTQRSGEKIFLLLRRHWFTYVTFIIIGIILSIPLLILLFYWLTNEQSFSPLALNISILAASAYVLFILAILLYGFIDYYLDVYIVTNERIIDIEQKGFFKRKISELHLHQVQDVNAQVNGMFATFFHFGDIYIQTAGERENFVFQSIPNPYRISKMIVDLHEAILESDTGEEEDQIAERIEGAPVRKMSNNLAMKEPPPFNLDLPTARLARKRTKDFIGGDKLVETGLGAEIQEEQDVQQSNHILDKVEDDKNEKALISNSVKKPKTPIKEDKEKENGVKKPAEKGKSGQLHENEEIKI